MAFSVIIYSADKTRGGILNKILKRNGLTSLLVNQLGNTQVAVFEHNPDVLIADLKNALRDEIVFLANIYSKLQRTFLIVLGGPVDINSFEKQVGEFALENNLHLTDPLSPELIVSKVKEALALREKTPQAKQPSLETDLKQFLKL